MLNDAEIRDRCRRLAKSGDDPLADVLAHVPRLEVGTVPASTTTFTDGDPAGGAVGRSSWWWAYQS